MDVSEVVLGFDARELWLDPSQEWPERRRELNLMRQDVARPLSVDTTSWPSVFGAAAALDASCPRPAWTGPVQALWSDLAALERHLATAWGHHAKAYAVVAVTLVAGAGGASSLARWWDRRMLRPAADGSWQVLAADTPAGAAALLGSTPAALDVAWERLGYDVADRWLTSGLSNGGIGGTGADAATCRATYEAFERFLNSHHLFDAVPPAARFARLADQRVSEHAPFFVYGLWRRRTTATGP